MKKILFLAFLVMLVKGYFSLTDGFKIGKITPGFVTRPSWNPPICKKGADLSQILSMEYTYLARGQQAYVFESADHQYVIKFIRMGKFRPPFWSYFPSLSKKIAAKNLSWEKCLKSFSLAETEWADESALLYSHMHPTSDLKQSVTLIDRLGRRSSVDLDPLYFVIQKKVELLKPHLLRLHAKNDSKEIKRLIDSFFATTHARAEKNIRNKNRNCMKNLGVLEGKVIEFDVGELRYRKDLDKKGEIAKSSAQFREFILNEMATYIPYFDEKNR